MNLVFDEYIRFLKDKGVEYDLKEGYYWLDRQIIKCYDKTGKIHNVLRLYVEDSLNLTYKAYDGKPYEIESWEETVIRNKDKLISLERESINLIKTAIEKYPNHEPITLTSGGKDSSVTMHLVRQVVSNSGAIFNNTSLDCADTYVHAKAIPNILIINPKEGFYQWRERLEFIPTRFARACCSIFKEGELVKQYDKEKDTLFFLGMRNQESSTRSQYQDYWRNDMWSNKWDGVLPIRKWTEEDIWLYILLRNIDVNMKYRKGYARCGCNIACPYYTKSTWILDEYWYSKGRQRWMDIVREDFIKNNKWLVMNCTLQEYYSCWNGGTFRDEPTDDVMQEFADYNKLSFDVAKTFFGHTCFKCEKKKPKKIKDKNVLAMNMKFIGRTGKYMCKKHLKEYLGLDNEQWDKYIESFKSQGCDLF